MHLFWRYWAETKSESQNDRIMDNLRTVYTPPYFICRGYNDVRPGKTITLGIHPVWSEFSLSAWRSTGSLATHWAQSKDSDQTGRTCHFVGFVMLWLIYNRTVSMFKAMIRATSLENQIYIICKQQRHRSACTSAVRSAPLFFTP